MGLNNRASGRFGGLATTKFHFNCKGLSQIFDVVWLQSDWGEILIRIQIKMLHHYLLRVNSVEECLFHTQIVGGSTPSLSIQYFNIHRCVNILEVDILKNFENDKDETCFCNDIDPNDYWDDDDFYDDDFWNDTYDCGCCTCCGCICDDDWDEDEI